MSHVDKDMHILVVDDYTTMRRIIRNLLKQLGFTNIDEASDGRSALLKLQGGGFDLVLSDWNMEHMSGLQLLREVRSDVKLKDIPFILITAESNSEYVTAAKEAGVSGYILKPFNAAAIKGKLEIIFGSF